MAGSVSTQELIDCCSPANEGALQCWGHGPNMAWVRENGHQISPPCPCVCVTAAQCLQTRSHRSQQNFLINNTHGLDATEASYPYNLHSRKGDNNQTWSHPHKQTR